MSKRPRRCKIIDVDNVIDDVINDPNTIASLDEREIDKCLEKVIPILENNNYGFITTVSGG